ncbi:MAG: tyrosine-type recombinase/integrase [Pseudomonadota bacterium]
MDREKDEGRRYFRSINGIIFINNSLRKFRKMGVFKKGDNWYIDYYVNGRRKRKKIGPSKKLTLQILKDVQVKMLKKEYLGIYEERKITLEEYVNQYLDYSKANKAWSTYQRRDRISVKPLISFFKGKYLFEITPQLIERYKAKRLEDVSPATVNRELACLKHMYTKAIEWGYVKTNPAKEVKNLKEPPGRLRYLMPEEINVLVKECAFHLRPIVVMALNSGMRLGEILNLKWKDVDLINKKVTIVNSKNNETRVIPINMTLYSELTLHQKNRNGEFVFADKKGSPYGSVKKSFATALDKAKIKDFRFHDLRHTFGSYLVMQGVDLKTIQQIMGHKDINMTMRYAHLSSEHVQKAVETLDNAWSLYGHQDEIKDEENPVSH